jgi:methionyl-tRNA formyltransferase
VERAILAGDEETGVCLMALEAGLDTGGVYAVTRVPIGRDESADQLRGRLVEIGAGMLVQRLAGGVAGLGQAVPQEGEPTYAAKLTPDDLRLVWDRPARELARVPRVGKAWTTFRGRRLLVLRAAAVTGPVPPPGTMEGVVVGTSDGGLELEQVQPEGRDVQDATAWLRGARVVAGERLGP